MYIYKTFQHDDEDLMDEGLETIDPATIVARIRKIVISIRSSLQKTQSFESHVRLAKIVPSDLQVILDVDTRWNSTFAMLERAKRLRVPLTTFAASDKTQNFELGAEDWKRLDNIISLLKPLDDMTNFLSKSNFPSLSTVIPSYVGCMEETRKVANDNASLSRAQIAIENKLDLYYQAVLKKSVYATSTTLDPRFKHSYFKGRKDAAAIKKQFLKDAEPYSKYSEKEADKVASANSHKVPPSPSWINRIFKKSKQSSLEEEVKAYLAEPISAEYIDPVTFWKSRQDRFPCLSTMAKVYFSVPATSTPSERCFSGGRLICHHTRGSLSSTKLSALMCLNSWLKNGFKLPALTNE